mgnify:FL=1
MDQGERRRVPRSASALLAARFAAEALDINVPQAVLQRAAEEIR